MKNALLGIWFVLASCECSLHDEAFELAGDGATDCGHVPVGASAAAAFECALVAMETHAAFVIRLELRGTDSHVVQAWVGQKDGDVFHLLYDGDPSGGSGVGARIERWTCLGPSRRLLTENDIASTSFGFTIAEGDDIISCSGEIYDGATCGD